jgi:site-specific recombinase XerD
VFASHNSTGLERKVAREALKRAVKAAKLTAPEPTLHDLRHSHASMLIALDYNLVDVQHRLGHRKPDTTLRIYTHQWKHHDAQRSHIGDHLQRLFADQPQTALPPPVQQHVPLALLAATSPTTDTPR